MDLTRSFLIDHTRVIHSLTLLYTLGISAIGLGPEGYNKVILPTESSGLVCIFSYCTYSGRQGELLTKYRVWEMKNATKATKQLYANMLHVEYKMIVKALKEGDVIDIMVVHGLSLNYEKKVGWIYA